VDAHGKREQFAETDNLATAFGKSIGRTFELGIAVRRNHGLMEVYGRKLHAAVLLR
jgi:hypothetical protein